MPTSEATDARVERWARGLCLADGSDPDGRPSTGHYAWWESYVDEARAAIALSDQEAAERVEATPSASAVELVEAFERAVQTRGPVSWRRRDTERQYADARSALLRLAASPRPADLSTQAEGGGTQLGAETGEGS